MDFHERTAPKASRIEQAGEEQHEADVAAEIAKRAEIRIAVLRKKLEMTARQIKLSEGEVAVKGRPGEPLMNLTHRVKPGSEGG